MFESDGSRFLSRGERFVLRIANSVRKRLVVRVRLGDRGTAATYLCENEVDAQRPVSLWIKEQGTMEWIAAEVRPDDVFMDIGANIGIYSIAAAQRMGAAGRVYAFEPHKVNGLSLMRNVEANGLRERIRCFSCALSDREGMLAFNYASLAAASTASQLGHRKLVGSGAEFAPVATEMVFATSVDRLIEAGTIDPPTLIKIDVDGNEIAILRGMAALLGGKRRPRAVQVELNVGEHDAIARLMQDCGYALARRHLTHAGKAAQDAGVPLAQIAHNAIFAPAS